LSSIGNSMSIGSGSGARIAAGARRTAAGRDGRRAVFLPARLAAAFRLLLLVVFFRFLAMMPPG
jgi:hypothetical protein